MKGTAGGSTARTVSQYFAYPFLSSMMELISLNESTYFDASP